MADVVDGFIRHQLEWIEANPVRARFLYSQGQIDWSIEYGRRVRSMNSDIAEAYRDWLTPLIARGEVRDLPMTVMVAIVTGPAHALAAQWLAGQLPGAVIDFADDLIDAAVAGLRGVPAPAGEHVRRRAEGRVRVQLLDADGAVLAETEIGTSLNPSA
ncbi:hypothetical protein ACIHDR_12600 [Nocardia sp. NPDC052278]|uniref:hypothetical protein n=1 Tax=unclassified Nocardia TaxID=2637762 RepID=UPI00368F7EC9